jgi:exopolyphosphatase/guanosine-5'-triphosphate,3'-diphosphate pyrophosphatase
MEPMGEEREPLAVVDIGSNSGRLVVFRLQPGGHLDILEDARASLRLARSLRDSHALGEAAIERTMEALRDFRAVARGAGVSRIEAVATAAVREASDRDVLLERARTEAGVELRLIGGDEEAEYGFLGAVHDLPVQNGVTMDLGGGSMELTHFRNRRAARAWTLPLGSLRLSDLHLTIDPPTNSEIKRLRDAVVETLSEHEVPPMSTGDHLVGVGGTIRNLGKIDRRRAEYPLPLLHGYVISVKRLGELVTYLAGRTAARRRSVPGLNPDRADSIVGGAIAAHTAAEVLGADGLMVSSRGLREGLALHLVGAEADPPREVRRTSILNLAGRFATWDRRSARRRALIANRLMETLEPESRPDQQEMLEHAAVVLDAGRALDYYERFEHAAMIVTAADVGGFTHGQLAVLTAILRQADADTRLGPAGGLLAKRDRVPVLRAATILALADEINRRIEPGRPPTMSCEWRPREFRVRTPAAVGWRPRAVADRFRKVFGRPLVVQPGPGG